MSYEHSRCQSMRFLGNFKEAVSATFGFLYGSICSLFECYRRCQARDSDKDAAYLCMNRKRHVASA